MYNFITHTTTLSIQCRLWGRTLSGTEYAKEKQGKLMLIVVFEMHHNRLMKSNRGSYGDRWPMQTYLGAGVWMHIRIIELLSAVPWLNHQASCHHYQILQEAQMRSGKTLVCWWNEGQGKRLFDGDGIEISLHQNRLRCSQLQQLYHPRHLGVVMPNQAHFSEVLVQSKQTYRLSGAFYDFPILLCALHYWSAE